MGTKRTYSTDLILENDWYRNRFTEYKVKVDVQNNIIHRVQDQLEEVQDQLKELQARLEEVQALKKCERNEVSE